MPGVASKSGVSNSSSRMHSSIYGSAMQAKPASNASRPASSGGAFKAGSMASRPFVAPVSNRLAAEDRLRMHGGSRTDQTATPLMMPYDSAAMSRQAAGARVRGRGDENDRNANLLEDGSGGVPMSPSIYSARSKQAVAMSPRYQQPYNPPNNALLSGDFTITDVSDAVGPVPGPPAPPVVPSPVKEAPPTPPPKPSPAKPSPAKPSPAKAPLRPASPPSPLPAAPLPPPTPPVAAAAPAFAAAPLDPAAAHLGKGVFAKVRLTHKADGQMVAVKTYDHKEAKEERAVAKHMANEERLAGKLHHENIIAPQVVHKGGGKTQLEMEYAPGGTLEEHVKQLKKPMSEAEARRLFRQIVDATVYLHAKGICHRDIKMENVVLDAEGNARLVDFGAAKEGGANTFLMSLQGTPAYMAPEVAQQKAHKGGPADVWALGVLLYNMVSGGAFPFWGRNMDDLRHNISNQSLRIPPHLSAPCKDLLNKLLQKSSAIRLSANDVRRHAFLKEQPGEVVPTLKDFTVSQPIAEAAPISEVDESAAWAAAAAHVPPAYPQRNAVNAGVNAEAAAAASAYRGELASARAAASQRLRQVSEPAAGGDARDGEKKYCHSPSRQAPQYQYASRNPITGGPGAGVGLGGSRPSSAAGSRPGSAGPQYCVESPRSSKLANLMNGSGTPGRTINNGRQAAATAQMHANRPRPF